MLGLAWEVHRAMISPVVRSQTKIRSKFKFKFELELEFKLNPSLGVGAPIISKYISSQIRGRPREDHRRTTGGRIDGNWTTPKPFWLVSRIALEGCSRRSNHSGWRAESLSRAARGAQTTLADEQNRSRRVRAILKSLWRPSRIALEGCSRAKCRANLGGKKLIHF